MVTPEKPSAQSEFDDVRELPKRALSTYARLWQLETWLRRMVYVELRALRADDWDKGIDAEFPFKADKRLRHMPTPEKDVLSFITFPQLTRLISEHWSAFDCYLPPQNIWLAKLEEVSQIRNRIAHFRSVHQDDHPRVLQFLRDLDHGFWTFCTSYNNPQPVLPAANDPVTAHFLSYDPFPWTETSDKKWMRIGHADPSMVLFVTVEVLRRPWAERKPSADGAAGYLYYVHIGAREGREFDYARFLDATANFHPRLVHICLENSARSVRLTIPALLGSNVIIGIVQRATEVAGYTVDRGASWSLTHRTVQALADDWPEYVLGPDNPLTFLDPGMPCTFFNA